MVKIGDFINTYSTQTLVLLRGFLMRAMLQTQDFEKLLDKWHASSVKSQLVTYFFPFSPHM